MFPAGLLLAAATVAFGPFEVDHVPGVMSRRLPEGLASAVDVQKCASVIPPSHLSAQSLSDFADCTDRNACLGDIGRTLKADFVVKGKLQKTDTGFYVRLTVFDVHTFEVRKYLEQSFVGKLSGLQSALQREQVPALCKIVDPDWNPIAALDFDTGADTKPDFDPGDLPSAEEPGKPSAPAVAAIVTPPVVHPVSPPVVLSLPKASASVPAVVTPPRPLPWGAIAGGGAIVLAATGLGLGVKSQSIWSGDSVTMVDGVSQHTLTQNQALSGNRDAIAADVLFGLAAAAGIASGVLIYVNGGLGLHF